MSLSVLCHEWLHTTLDKSIEDHIFHPKPYGNGCMDQHFLFWSNAGLLFIFTVTLLLNKVFHDRDVFQSSYIGINKVVTIDEIVCERILCDSESFHFSPLHHPLPPLSPWLRPPRPTKLEIRAVDSKFGWELTVSFCRSKNWDYCPMRPSAEGKLGAVRIWFLTKSYFLWNP